MQVVDEVVVDRAGHVLSQASVFALGYESRKIRYFWVVRKFKVLVFRSGRLGSCLPRLDKTGLKMSDWIFPHPHNI